MADLRRVAVLSRGLRRVPHLACLLGARIVAPWSDCDAVAGWGLRPAAQNARRLAVRLGLPYLGLEDGFLRSVGLGVEGWPALSLVVDDLGIYYDASRPSRLERLIAKVPQEGPLLAEADRAMALFLRHRLSKYNHAPDACPPLPVAPRVLLLDQAGGDLSLAYGGVDGAVFQAMLAAALAEHPAAAIVVKTHPDVLAGKRRGHFDPSAEASGRVSYLAADVNPAVLLEQVDVVYVATSHMGFEALLRGKKVVCFGLPWYAGWGLTDDRHPGVAGLRERRPGPRSLRQLFAAAYLQYARYVHPETGEAGDIFAVIDYLVWLRRLNEAGRGSVYCVGMSLWKRQVVKPFLRLPSAKLECVRSLRGLERRGLPPDARLVVWSRRAGDAEIAAFAARRGIPVWRMEDGFLRSVGLGSDLLRPLSLVVDEAGVYCDASRPSTLESWLEQGRPGPGELERARRLREDLVRLRLSKYNIGRSFALAPQAAGKRVLLVVGQVESDASIRFGSPRIQTNLALLQAVRAADPDAFLVFKPHPDVVAGNRPGAVEAGALSSLCGQVAADADIIDCIGLADEVHVMTSLAGFEALLHGKPVHCHGLPFYAGWGLTQDRLAAARRSRRLSLDELVYGALIHYPRYIDPKTLAFISVERAVALLEQARRQGGGDGLVLGFLLRQWRKLWAYLRVLAGR